MTKSPSKPPFGRLLGLSAFGAFGALFCFIIGLGETGVPLLLLSIGLLLAAAARWLLVRLRPWFGAVPPGRP